MEKDKITINGEVYFVEDLIANRILLIKQEIRKQYDDIASLTSLLDDNHKKEQAKRIICLLDNLRTEIDNFFSLSNNNK